MSDDLKIRLKLLGEAESAIKALKDTEQATDGLEKETDQLGNTTEKTKKKTGDFSKKLLKVASAAAVVTGALAVIGLGKMVADTIKSATEISKLSTALNISAEDLTAWQFASEKVDVNAEKMADVFKDLNDRVGDYAVTGAGPLVDVMEQTNLQIEDLIQLSPDKQLLKIYDALDKIDGITHAEKTFYLEALAGDASKLIPLLENGGEKFKELEERAQNLGIIMTDMDVSRLQVINNEWKQQGDLIGGVSNMITNGLAPVIHGALGNVNDLSDGWLGLGITSNDVTSIIINVMGDAIDIITGIETALKLAEIAYLTLGEVGTGALLSLGDIGAQLANKTLGAIVRSIGEAIGAFREMAKTSAGILSVVPGMQAIGVALKLVGNSSDKTIKDLKDYKITVESISNSHKQFADDLIFAKDELDDLISGPSGVEKARSKYNEWSASLDKSAKALQKNRDKTNKSAHSNRVLGTELKELIASQGKSTTKRKADTIAISEQQKALNALHKSFNDEIQALTLSGLKLNLTERQYYKSTLAVRGFTDEMIESSLALWDQNKALSVNQKSQKEFAKTQEEIAQAQARSVEELSDTMDSWFNNLFENGTSAFDDLWDSAQSFFRNLAAQMARKWVLQLVGVGSASVGGVAQAGGLGGAGGGTGSIGSLLTGNSIGTSFSQFGGTLDGLFGGGNIFGAAGGGGFAASNAGFGLAGLGGALFGSMLGGKGSEGGSIGAMIGNAILPGLGGVIGAGLGGLVGSLFGGKKTVTADFQSFDNRDHAYGGWSGDGIKRNTTGKSFWRESDLSDGFGLLSRNYGGETVALNRDDKGQIEGVMAALDSFVELDNVIASFLTDEEKKQAKANLDNFEGDGLDIETLTTERLSAIFDAMPEELAKLVDLNGPIEDVVAEISELSVINDTLLPTMKDMGFEFDETNSYAIATVHGLAEAKGGLNAFANSLSAFYSVSQNYAGDIEALKFRLLEDDEARYDYLKAQSDELVSQLQTATDIDTITSLSEQIRLLTNQGVGLLTEDQIQGGMGQEQVDFFEQTQQLSNDRLQSAIDKQGDAVGANAQTQDIAAKSLENSAGIFGSAAKAIMESAAVINSAAGSMTTAASTPQNITVTVQQAVGSELGLA